MRHKFLVVTVKRWLKSVYIYENYRIIKTGVPLFDHLVGLSLFKFLGGLENETICLMSLNVIQGFDFGTDERAYANSYWSSSCHLVGFCWKLQHPSPIPPEFWSCFPWTKLPMWGLQGAKTLKLITRVIIFKVTPLIWQRYLRRTDRRTADDSNTALCTTCSVL